MMASKVVSNSAESNVILPIIVQEDSPKKCPWGATSPQKLTLNLSDIMSEELAKNFQLEEEAHFIGEILNKEDMELCEFPTDPVNNLESLVGSSKEMDTNSDRAIAQMLQFQYNKEYDENLKRVENKFNGVSKVSVSLSNYMASPTSDQDSSDEDDDETDPKDWDSFEKHARTFPQLSKTGYVRVNNEMVTKHDVTMNGRKNACKVMESFPPCIRTGDGASFDMQLSNKVYNTLKVYSKAEECRRNRIHDKAEKSTSEMAIDRKTRLALYKLVNNGILEKVYGIIATGKEAVVIYADGGKISEETPTLIEIPSECAIKVFKTSLNEFKTRDKYIKDDFRFKDRFSKQNPRKIIHLWAEKEMHNLHRMQKAKILCPKVVLLKKHILILSFIGINMRPAPKLKDVSFPKDDDDFLLRSAYDQTIDMMHRLYKQCDLVHSDLSEFNILWHENQCYFIDVSQSVEPHHPSALEFLYRDCSNIINFFGKRGLSQIHSAESLFTSISEYHLDGSGAEILHQIRDYEKNLELLTFAKPEKSYPFEYCWEKEQRN